METVTVERTIAAPPSAVFDWISNAHNYTRIGMVLHERLAVRGDTAPYGRGAVRVLIWAVGCFWERITAYDPPHSFEYHVYRSIPPSRHEGGRVDFAAAEDGGTRVRWTTTAELRLPLAGAYLTRRVMRPLLRYAFDRVLDEAARAVAPGR
ncbi:SRPBCC family protein [Nocardia bovistercoris]|uniref:SRPBCC family protein n=1 Tax=Nocardia bovistercoris TaxID=2785916 RepID=A0A931N471_9NOCA|nr:SRPBCC family protein [Nocardia bovistercoris]MBH0777951.1 SRPBCC family protein [Nocardia bovistercoris]